MADSRTAPQGIGQPWLDHQDLRWESDWNGYEVGHDDVGVIGLWRWRDTGVYMYLDAETMEIVSVWEVKED